MKQYENFYLAEKAISKVADRADFVSHMAKNFKRRALRHYSKISNVNDSPEDFPRADEEHLKEYVRELAKLVEEL